MEAMVQTRKTKPYILGLSIGTFWLVAVGAGFAIFTIVGATNAKMTLIAVSVIAGTLLAVSIRHIAKALKLPSEPRSTQDRRDRRIGRQFALIVVLEGAAIALVSTACSFTGHWSLLGPLVLIIVGIHFMPL